MPTFNAEEKNLMLIQAMDSFASSLAGIFVTVYFFSQSDLKTTILYNIVMYTSLLFFYIASGWSLKKFSSAFLIRVGLVAGAGFYFLLFVLREQSIKFVIPLGILSGFGAGNYWAGLNLNQYIFTNQNKRVEYFGSITTIVNILSAVAPLVGGVIITVTKSMQIFSLETGYAFLFFIVYLIFAVMGVFTGKLPSHGMPNFSYRHIFAHQRTRSWKLLLWQEVFLGLYDSSLGIITGIPFYLIVKSEINLGATQTVAYFLGALGSLISIRLLNKHNNFYWIGALGLAGGIGFFAIWQNWFGVIFFITVTGFCTPFLNNWLSTIYFKLMDAVNTSWTEKYHLMIERDSALGLARILSFTLIWVFLQSGDQVTLARTWLYFLPIIPLVLGFLLWKMKPVSLASDSGVAAETS